MFKVQCSASLHLSLTFSLNMTFPFPQPYHSSQICQLEDNAGDYIALSARRAFSCNAFYYVYLANHTIVHLQITQNLTAVHFHSMDCDLRVTTTLKDVVCFGFYRFSNFVFCNQSKFFRSSLKYIWFTLQSFLIMYVQS